MSGFNRVILVGNLTRDPELRYLPNNTAVCNFGLAMNRTWRDRDGNQQEEVCFVDVAVFGRGGEIVNQYMSKGRSLLVEGRLKLETWTSQDGGKRSKLSVVAENFQFLGDRGSGGGDGGGGNYGGGRERAGGSRGGEYNNYDDRRGGGDPGGNYGGQQPPPPSGDDIPF